jgi:hypothetical protein
MISNRSIERPHCVPHGKTMRGVLCDLGAAFIRLEMIAGFSILEEPGQKSPHAAQK